MPRPIADQPSPFDRLPGESPAAFTAFLAYRDLGPGGALRRRRTDSEGHKWTRT